MNNSTTAKGPVCFNKRAGPRDAGINGSMSWKRRAGACASDGPSNRNCAHSLTRTAN